VLVRFVKNGKNRKMQNNYTSAQKNLKQADSILSPYDIKKRKPTATESQTAATLPFNGLNDEIIF